MKSSRLACLCSLLPALAAAAPPAIEALATRPQVFGATLSPDGHYVAMLRAQGDKGAVVAYDRQAKSSKVLMGEPEGTRLLYCHWVSEVRLVCAYLGFQTDRGWAYGYTRLVGIDVDGQNMKVLAQNNATIKGQGLANIVAWHTDKPEVIRIQADEGAKSNEAEDGAVVLGGGTHAVPAVWSLDTRTDRATIFQHGRPPIINWKADPRGEVRLGFGLEKKVYSIWSRLPDQNDWHRLTTWEAFKQERGFVPVAISASDPMKAYAFAAQDGRDAAWLLDLAEREPPKLLYSHDSVDVDRVLLDEDGELIGFRYDTDYPRVYYVDPAYAAAAAAGEGAFKDHFVEAIQAVAGKTLFLLRVSSDRDAASYVIYNAQTHGFMALAAAYPSIDPASLGAMKPISFAARDGTVVTGYLTAPAGGEARNAPLIVMPHGGPIHRDTWEFDFLRHFLGTRGYAVLQVNFRGSSGFGYDWLHAGHQAWGGVSYDDVVDGVQAMVKQGVADPARIGIVGWSFGGYIAELAAMRDPGLFKCSAAIAGVSDLSLLIDEEYYSIDYQVVREQVGTDKARLAADSPRQHAADFRVPILLVHGDHDTQVDVEHSKTLDKALSRAGRPHRLVLVPGGDHSLSRSDSQRVTLLRELEAFLGKECPASR